MINLITWQHTQPNKHNKIFGQTYIEIQKVKVSQSIFNSWINVNYTIRGYDTDITAQDTLIVPKCK